jgi:hypothetical protein
MRKLAVFICDVLMVLCLHSLITSPLTFFFDVEWNVASHIAFLILLPGWPIISKLIDEH